MEILIIIFLILLNGVFPISEIALVSSGKFKLERAAKKGSIDADLNHASTNRFALSMKFMKQIIFFK